MVSGGIGGNPEVGAEVMFEFPAIALALIEAADTAGEAVLSAEVNDEAGLVSEGIEVVTDEAILEELLFLVLVMLLLDLFLSRLLVSFDCELCCRHFALRFLNHT